MIWKFLQRFDLIGPKPEFFINNSRIYQTIFGAILTILLFMLTFICLLTFGVLSIFERSEPFIYDYQVRDSSPRIDRDYLQFMIAPLTSYGMQISEPEKVVNISLNYGVVDPKTTAIYTSSLVLCKTTRSFLHKRDKTWKMYDNYFCIPDEFDYDLIGSRDAFRFTQYSFKISPCLNQANHSQCLPSQVLENEYTSLYLHFIYPDNYIDLTKFHRPIEERFMQMEYIQINMKEKRYDTYSFKTVDVLTDSGWLWENISTEKTFQLSENIKGNGNPIGYSGGTFEIGISISKLKDVYMRKYIRLPAILAYTGGIMNVFIYFFTFINHFFTRKLLAQSIFDSYLKEENFFPQKDVSKIDISVNQKVENVTDIHLCGMAKKENVEGGHVELKEVDISNTMPREIRKIKYKRLNFQNLLCLTREHLQTSIKLEHALRYKFDVGNLMSAFDNLRITDMLLFDDAALTLRKYLASCAFYKDFNGSFPFLSSATQQALEESRNNIQSSTFNPKETLVKMISSIAEGS